MTSQDLGPLRLADAELRVETTSGQEFVADGDDPDAGVLEVGIEQHAADKIDQADIVLLNNDGRYGTENRITRGDKAEWWVRLEGETELTRRWTGLVEEVSFQRIGPNTREVQLTADDYVFGILSDRVVFRSFFDEPIVDIIESLVNIKAPEITTDLPDTDVIGTETDVVANGKNLLEIVTSLAKRAGALLFGDGTTLRMEPIGNLETKLVLSEDNIDAAIGGQYSYVEQPDDLVTFARVDGGDASAEDDVQEDQDGFETVTESDRKTVRIAPTRSKLDRVELIPRQLNEHDESIRVRIQRDDGGQPVDLSDPNADIASREVEPDDPRWRDEEWSEWLLQEHIAHDQDPWLIIETTGENGQEIAVAGDGTPTYRTFYSYPIIAESTATADEKRYGRVERAIEEPSIRSFEAAQDEANAVVRENNHPREEFTFEAGSPATFDLEFGDAVRLDFPEDGATGQFVVADRSDTWGEAIDLRSQYLLRSVRSI